MLLQVGHTVSHYRILEHLGGGGMGVVYKAQDLKLDRPVALKFLPPELTRDPEAKERFIHEAKAASSLDHQNICVVHDIGETDDGQIYIVMAYYDGETLKRKIARGGLGVDEAVGIALQVARGLAQAHEHGIIHRDIKPANIMVTSSGVAKIVDFGVAKLSGRTLLTRAGSTIGTAAYMSPEQARGEAADQRTDLWSLAVLLYEMICGQRPFDSEYEQALVYAILNNEPHPLSRHRPGIPEALEQVVRKALAKRPDDRYQTAGEFVRDLEAVASAAFPPPGTRRGSLWTRKRLLLATAIVASLAVTVILVLQLTAETLDAIAVLPIENLSGDPDQEYFSDGMTVAIITELEKVKSLRPISWQSVKRFKKTDKGIPEIASELGVQAVVTAQVAREGESIRISASLIQASPERQLWAGSFTKEKRNILALQSEIARAIVREINVAVTPLEARRLSTTRQVDPLAEEAYLKGRQMMERMDRESLENALRYFRKAIQIDSNHANGYLGIALARWFQFWRDYTTDYPYNEMESNATRALAIDSTLGEACSILGRKKAYWDRDFRTAERHFRKAVELTPGSYEAHDAYGGFLSNLGYLEEGLVEFRIAQELHPLSLIVTHHLAISAFRQFRYEESIRHCREILEVIPNYDGAYFLISLSLMELGRYPEAREAARRFDSLSHKRYEVSFLYGLLHYRAGEKDRTRLIADTMGARPGEPGTHVRIAQLNAALGDTDRAFDELEKALEARAHLLFVALTGDPYSKPLTSDPRFRELRRRMGLEEPWREKRGPSDD